LSLLGPRVLTVLFIQIIFIVRDNLASSLPTGSVSALTYGWMIMQVPETLIGTVIGTALLPTLSELAARKNWEGFTSTISRAVRVLTALTIPLSIILALGLRPFISLAFHFDDAGTTLTMQVTTAFLVGLLAHSIIEVGARAFYSLQDAKIPLLASLMTLLIFILTSYLTVKPFGASGIAASVSIAFTCEMILLISLLMSKLKFTLRILPTILRTVLTSAIVFVIFYVLQLFLRADQLIGATISMIISMAIGFLLMRKEIRELIHL
jgi:putative peptidoglycan lipid II flippase